MRSKTLLERLLTNLRKVAPDSVETLILQPADPFLDTAGEDLRRRIFITEAADGSLNCMRPDFTIPICQQHVKSGSDRARYAYGGTVFRQEREGGVEFQQVGLEDLGNADTVAADVASLSDMIGCLDLAGIKDCRVTLGDQQLFAAIVKALALPETQAERLERNFGAADVLDDLITAFEKGQPQQKLGDSLEALVKNGFEARLVVAVGEMMNKAGLSPKAGRSPEDIARRMIEKRDEADFRLSPEGASILRIFLSIEAPLSVAVTELEDFAAASGIDFGDALNAFKKRIELLSDASIDPTNFHYRASFGRKLDYYTGLLFEAHSNGGEALAGGGRYDHLCTILGAEQPVPAVGFSVMLDRIEEALR